MFLIQLVPNAKEHDDNFLVSVISQSGAKNNNFNPIKLATHIHQEVIQSVNSQHDNPYFMGRYIQSWWMHPPTLVRELVDASTDSVYRVGGCINRL